MSTPVDTFLTNLKLLGFDQTVHCKGTSVIVDQNIFTLNANNTKAFEIISHFLFRSLDRVKTRTIFKHVWPPKTKQQSREYLNISFRWLEEIKYKSLLQHTPLRKSYFEDCRGKVMNKIMMAFSTYVLEQVLLTKKNIDILQLENMDKELLELKVQELGKELVEKESNINNSRKRWSQEGQDIISQLSSSSPKRQKTSNKSSSTSPSSFLKVNYRLNNTVNHILQKKEEREKQRQEIEERKMQEHLERERQYLEEQRLQQEKLERERQYLEEQRLQQKKLEHERLEKERLEQERVKQEHLKKERAEQERREKERIEVERLEKERLEKERAEQERLRQKRLEEERLEQKHERAEREKLEQERQKLEEERLEKQRKKLEQERIDQQRREEQRLQELEREEQRREEQRLMEIVREEKRLEQEKLKQQQLEEQMHEQEILEEQECEQQQLEEQLEEMKREQQMLEDQLREQQRLEEKKFEQQRIEEREHQRLEEEMIEKQKIEEERLIFQKLEQERVELHRLEKHKFKSQKLEKMKRDRQMLGQQKLDEQDELQEWLMLDKYQKSPRSKTMQYSPARSSRPSPSRFSQPSPSRYSQPSPSRYSQPSPSRFSQPSPSRLPQPSPSRRSKTPRSTHLRKPFNLRQKLLEILNTPAEVNPMYILPPLPKSPPSRTSSIVEEEEEQLNQIFSPGKSIKRHSLLSLGKSSKASVDSNCDPMEITSLFQPSPTSKRSAPSPFRDPQKGFLMSPSRTTSLNNSWSSNRDSYSPLTSTKKPFDTPPPSIMEPLSSRQIATITPLASSLFVELPSSKEASFISTTRSSPVRVPTKDSPFMVNKTSPISPLRSVPVNEPLSSLSYEREPISSKQASPFRTTSKTTTVDSLTRQSAAYEPVSPRRATPICESIFSKQAPASPHRPIIGSPLRSTSVYEPELRIPASPSSRLSKETVLSPSRSTGKSSSPNVTPKRVDGSPARSTHNEPKKVFASPMRPTLRGIDDEDDDMCLQGMESVISIRLEEPPWTPMTTSYSPGDAFVDLNVKTPVTRNLYRYNE